MRVDVRHGLLLAIVACGSHEDAKPVPVPPPVAPEVKEDPARPTHGDIAFGDVPALSGGFEGRYDATLSTVVRERFGTMRGRSCGVLEIEASGADVAAAKACVADVLVTKHSFVLIQRVQGEDSGIEHALVGVADVGGFTVYWLSYDSDPCGGGCRERGGTRMYRCTAVSPIGGACSYPSILDCYGCDGRVAVDSWYAGKETKLPRAEAERSVARLLGPTPATMGPLFADVALGAGARADRFDAVAAPASAGGVLTLAAVSDAKQLLAVNASVAGRCGAFYDRIAAVWGASQDDTWIAGDKRAFLDRERCVLRFGRSRGVKDWIGGVVPLDAIGKRTAEVRKQIAAAHELRVEPGWLQWNDVGIGRRGGVVELSIGEDHGKVNALVVTGETDPKTIVELRAHLVTRFGTPFQDDRINDGALFFTAWGEKPEVELSAPVEGNAFELRVNGARSR